MVKSITIFLALIHFSFGAETALVSEPPLIIQRLDAKTYLVDFGKVSFGNIELISPSEQEVTVHFGEDFKNGRVNRKPRGSVRYQHTSLNLTPSNAAIAAPPADKRNTNIRANAVLTPKDWGVILPFRWVEVEGWDGELTQKNISRHSAYLRDWNDQASSFSSSNPMLNKIWNLCKDSIKTTTFAGVYVDGDRERIPYEADAYINQLCHYYLDPDKQISRDTFDYLLENPTWPSEWAYHMVFIAYADWMHTADEAWLSSKYDALKPKLLLNRVGPSGLITSDSQHIRKGDLIDWPKGERDHYEFTEQNTVVNAFYIRSLQMMAQLAEATGRTEDSIQWLQQAELALTQFNSLFLNKQTGLYIDGAGSNHSSLHANLFPLAFDLVPGEYKKTVLQHLKSKGMACSVYAAQYLLEALYNNGASQEALDLMTAPNTDRSWAHMVNSGATITWEAWDLKYKPNQDWNHAWGAAPANIIPRFILGVEPLQPGWKVTQIKPSLGDLEFAKGSIPTPHGALDIICKSTPRAFHLELIAPSEMAISLSLPTVHDASKVTLNGKETSFSKSGNRYSLSTTVRGKTSIHIH